MNAWNWTTVGLFVTPYDDCQEASYALYTSIHARQHAAVFIVVALF